MLNFSSLLAQYKKNIIISPIYHLKAVCSVKKYYQSVFDLNSFNNLNTTVSDIKVQAVLDSAQRAVLFLQVLVIVVL